MGIGRTLKLAAALTWAKITGNVQRVNELKMSQGDPGWLSVFGEYFDYFRKKNRTINYIRYKDLDDFIIPIEKDVLKIAFISDWGTGRKDAEWLLSETMKHQPDLLIHLGDIYYSGTKNEVKTHFLDVIKKYVNFEKTKVLTLAGNHDMYSGGEGYYWLLEQLGQPASYFSLRNDYWQFLAMDTGLNDADPFTIKTSMTFLDPAEVEWHLHKLMTSGRRKTVLLSHHQLFSDRGVGIDNQGRKVAFNPHLERAFHTHLKSIEVWLWGHEHDLIIFNPYIHLKRGRCIGASALSIITPSFLDHSSRDFNLLGQSLPPTANEKVHLAKNPGGDYYHNYVIMDINKAHAKMNYYQVDSINEGESELLYQESL